MINFDVDQALAKLEQLAERHGGKAMQAAADVKRVNSLNDVVAGVVGLLFGVVLTALFITLWPKETARDAAGEIDIGRYFPLVPVGLIAAFGWLAALFSLLDAWTWVGVFNPKLALAKDIWNKLTETKSEE